MWTDDVRAAGRAESAVLAEVDRLTGILNTRDPDSEISRHERGESVRSRDLAVVLAAYDRWSELTGGVVSVRPRGAGTARNVDALGKAYILDRAVLAARAAAPRIDGLLLNIGGDIVARGCACEIAIADPASPHENAPPRSWLRLQNAAVATSGIYARGEHLLDGRTGLPATSAAAATVLAPDAVTANALATYLCLANGDEGLSLVEWTPGADALRVGRDGAVARTSGFSRVERPRIQMVAQASEWPAGYEVDISLTLTATRGGFGGFGGFRQPRRPYVGVWVENSAGRIVRLLAFWASKPKYFSELSSLWNLVARDQKMLYSSARATRDPGRYRIVWDGLDNDKKAVPPGAYRVVVETNQEHGVYAKQAGTITCGASPATATLPATANFEAVAVRYGPKSQTL